MNSSMLISNPISGSSLLGEGNRKLKTVTAIILIRHLIFEIVLIKGNASEKEMKEKERSLNMAMRSKSPVRCFQIVQLFFSYVGSSSVQLKDLTVQILFWLSKFDCSSLSLVSNYFSADYPWKGSMFLPCNLHDGDLRELWLGEILRNISLGAIHSHTFLVGQSKCDPRPPTFYAWQQSWQLQDLFSCITVLCNYT